MPMYRCENDACLSKGKTVFLGINLPIAECVGCRGVLSPASMKAAAPKAAAAAAGPAFVAPALRHVAPKPVVAAAKDALALQLEEKAKKRINLVTDTVSQLMEWPGGSQNFALPVKYRFWESGRSVQDREVTIEIPIYVHGAATGPTYWTSKGWSADSFTKTVHQGGKPGVTAVNITDEVKKKWSAKINACWGKAAIRWTTTSTAAAAFGKAASVETVKERFYNFKFEFRFVDDPADAAAQVICTKTAGEARAVNPTGTIDAVRWGFEDTNPDTLGPICHEVGHLIGNPDEYHTITFNGQRKAWGAGYQAGDGIGVMNNPDKKPLVRNYQYIAAKIADQLKITKAQADCLLDVATPSTTPKRNLNLAIWD